MNAPAFDNQIPEIQIVGAFTLGGNGQGFRIPQNVFDVDDSLSYVRGRHAIIFGGGVSYTRENFGRFHFIGGLIFLSFPDFLPGLNSSSNGTLNSNVFGSVDLAGLFDRQWRIWNGNAFVQDNIKLFRRFTLNLGLRYERQGAVGDNLGRNSVFNATLANPNPPATGSQAGYVVASNYSAGPLSPGVSRAGNSSATNGDGQNTWGPRIGFAWQLPRVNRLVLRGGYGIYYSRTTTQPILQLLTAAPFGQFRQLTGPANANATFANPFLAAPPSIPFFPAYSPPPSVPSTTLTLSPSFRPPIVQQYSLNLQTDLGHNFLLEVGYEGARGTKLVRNRSIKLFLPAPRILFVASPQTPLPTSHSACHC